MKLSVALPAWLSDLRNEGMSRPDFERKRLGRFRKLVAFVNARSAHYKDIISERGIDIATCAPEDFPVLTKAELMRDFDRIATDPRITRAALTDFLKRSKDPLDRYLGEFHVLHTSGSSGEVGIFAFSRADWTRGVTPGLRMNPLSPKRRRLAFYGMTSGHYAGVSFAQSAGQGFLKPLYEVLVCDINAPVERTIEALNRFQPDILMGYSSAIASLAEFLKRGELRISPRSIQGSGEAVVASERAIIEEAFAVPFFNVYTCTEHLIVGYGRSEFGGMYLFEDELIFELMGDHCLVTNLFNRTLPLIRYRMNDILEMVPDPKPEFPFLKIRESFGRQEQTPYFRNESGALDFVSPHAINELFIENVRRFQLVVTGEDSCALRLCLEEGLADASRQACLREAKAALVALLATKRMGNVRVQVEESDELPVDPKTGKFRLIVPAQG